MRPSQDINQPRDPDATRAALLAAEAQLRDRQTQYHLAQLDVVRARVRLQLATGQLAQNIE